MTYYVPTNPVVRAYQFTNRYYDVIPGWMDVLRKQGRVRPIGRNAEHLELRDNAMNPTELVSRGSWIVLDEYGALISYSDSEFQLRFTRPSYSDTRTP